MLKSYIHPTVRDGHRRRHVYLFSFRCRWCDGQVASECCCFLEMLRHHGGQPHHFGCRVRSRLNVPDIRPVSGRDGGRHVTALTTVWRTDTAAAGLLSALIVAPWPQTVRSWDARNTAVETGIGRKLVGLRASDASQLQYVSISRWQSRFNHNRISIDRQKARIRYTHYTRWRHKIVILKSANVSKRKTHASDKEQNSTPQPH